jgi:hypothetical protein
MIPASIPIFHARQAITGFHRQLLQPTLHRQYTKSSTPPGAAGLFSHFSLSIKNMTDVLGMI